MSNMSLGAQSGLATGWGCPARTVATDAEADFVLRGARDGDKAAALTVAGTAKPVLCLPVWDRLRVRVGGRLVRIGKLQPGTRVAVRLDMADREIMEMRVMDPPGTVEVL